LGVTLKELGRLEEAIISLNRAVELKPDYVLANFNLGSTLSLFKAKSFSTQLEKSYLSLLNLKTIVRPTAISHSVVSLLKHHDTVKQAINYLQKNDIKDLACELCIRLSDIPLFLKIIELCPIADLEIEHLLKNLRKILLLERQTLSYNKELLSFQSSLAFQCFTNEFIYEETEEERLAVKALESVLQQPFAENEDFFPYQIACLSSYRPLNLYPWVADIVPPSGLGPLFQRQIIEVNQERTLRKDIPRLNPIKDDVSLAVQKQYEANPYPRWIDTSLAFKPLTIVELMSKLEFQLDSGLNDFPDNPQVLIAGCGTGQHPLIEAARLKNSHVTAVDLSLSSLSYAIRKTREYSVTNIDYIQADILDLEMLGKQFDIVQSVGVLHHMKDPLLGWKNLESCLKPGGLMKIGLYGEVARKNIVMARDIISNLNIGTSHKEMVEFREHIKSSADPLLASLQSEEDFYSTSAFRDLVFHVQEHRFTAHELQKCFNILNLTFIGFEYPSVEEKRYNQALFPHWGSERNDIVSDQLDFPRHNFWLQKPLSPHQ
jgi:2-polyprenyl-3-methyl-5-hydroxy-6-metoxy-1,4-benzoquinol methylase